jgi:hypothetical protein
MGMLKGIAMADLLLLSEAQVRRIKPYFTLSHGSETVLRYECAGQCATPRESSALIRPSASKANPTLGRFAELNAIGMALGKRKILLRRV